MALIIADRVKETTITTGIGTISLSGRTFGGFQTFAEAIGDNNTTYYCIQNESDFEIGLGTYLSGTLSRDTVFQSSNSDNKLNLSGASVVFCVVPADKLIYSNEDDSVVFPTPFVFKRSDDGDYWQALSTSYTNRVVSFFIDDGSDPTWKIGLKTTSSELIAPYYAYVSGKDGFIELRGNSSSILSIGDGNSEGLQVNHQLKNIIDIRKNGGEIAIQNLDLNSDETTTAKNTSIAYTVFAVESSASHAADLQTWSVATDEKASLDQHGNFETVGSIISPSGRFTAIRFSDGTIQTTAALPLGSGSLIDQNTQNIITNSGYFQTYIDSLDHNATSVSGWAESYIDETSGNLQSQIDINESNISTVSGLIGDADFLPGASGGLIDQNAQDILTVSGLLYDNSAVSGYFESRVDQADSNITANSGYFESRVDSADSNINTVSGLLTPSGESFDFSTNILTYNNSDGGSFSTDLSSLSSFDTSGVSLSYSAGTLTYTNNAGGSFDVDISSISGDVYALIVDGAPTTLDTLNEIAAALNDDDNIATTLTDLISTTSGNLQSQITDNDSDILQLNNDVSTVSGLLYNDASLSGYFESRVDSADSSITANSGYFETRVDQNEADIVTVSGLIGGGESYDDTYISGVSTFASGLAIQNASDIITVSGLLYDDAAISGYFESRVDSADSSITANSGYFESRVDQSDSDIATVSGLLYDDAAISGYFESRVDSADSDIATVSGLLYDDAAISGYFESRVDSSDSSITANSGYFESRVDSADSDIATVSGLLYDDAAISGYFESRVDGADSDIATVSGLLSPKTFDITGGDNTNYTIDGMGLNSANDPTIYLHKGHTYIFNKTFSGHPFRISDTDGGSVYQDADGNNIEIGSSAGAVTFEVPQNAPDKLYYYCTQHPSTMKGVIYTTTDGSTSGYFESRVDSADSDIVTVSGLLYDDAAISGYFESRVDTNAADIITVSGLTGGGSSLTVQDVDGSPSVSNVTTIRVTNGTLTDDGGGTVTIATSGGGGGGGTTYTAGSGLSLVGTEFNVYGGSGHFINLQNDGVTTLNSGIKTAINTEADGATITFDMDAANTHISTLAGNRTLALSNVDAGQRFCIKLSQDGVGSRTVTWWNTINWLTLDGSPPTLKTDPGADDYFGFVCTSGGYYDGFHLTEVSTGGGGGGSYDDTYISGVSTFASGLAIQNQTDIATVSGLLYDDAAVSGYFESRVDQADSDILTVSGLLYDDAAVSGYFESRVDSADSSISTNSSSITANSGYFESRVDAADTNISTNSSSITANSGYFESRVDSADSSITANSGYFESRVDSADSSITANSGYFESRVDTNAADIVTVSGLIGGGDVTTEELEYVSGIAVYASGLDNFLLNPSGAGGISVTSDPNFVIFSGDATLARTSDLNAISGIAVYASGHNLQSITDNGSSTTNAITITNNNITASSGLFDSLDMTPLGNGSQPAYQEGVVFYDSENHTLSLYNDEADVTLQLGQEEFLRVRNNTGATIQNGTAVLINGAHGNAAPTISGAIATSEVDSQVIGLATHSIEDGSFGYVTTYGIVRDVDTSAFSAGDEVFLSATQIGSGVAVAPVIPNYKISLGHVINSASSNGSILVQVGNPKLGGGDLKSEAPLNMSGVPFVTSISDTNAGGSQTDPLFIFDSGNRQLQLGSGIQLLDGAPNNTSNVLYNDGGTLSFNGSAVDTNTTYSAGSGLTLVDTEFNVYGGSGQFIDLKLQSDGIDDLLTLTSTDDGSSAAPVISTMRDSASPTDGDYLGQLKFKGRSDTGTERVYAKITGKTLDVTNGTEDGLIEIAVISNGSQEIISRIRNDGWRIVNDNNLYIQDNGSLGVRVDPTYSLHIKDDAYIGSGVTLPDVVPAVTTNKLYNNGGTLTFNGSAVGGGTSYTAGSGITIDGADQINVYGGSGHFINLDVEGAFTATTKSFLIDHPSKSGMKLQYGSLEGPENGVYVRGTTSFNKIILPDYWKDLIDEETITITLTPVYEFQPLFVKNKNCCEIEVGGNTCEYDYVVYAERKDVEKLEVEW